MNTGLIFHESYFWYDSLNQAFPPFSLQPGGNPDRPDIKRRFHNLLSHTGILKNLIQLEPRQATEDEILRAHSEQYFSLLQQQDQSALAGTGGPGAVFAAGGLDIARLAAGGVITAVEAVFSEQINNAYALVRPPGHHAETNQGAGFCILNNGAIAAKYALAEYLLERVAIIDWDVHHGNGAQEIFWEDPSVLTMSVHQDYHFLPEDTGTLSHNGRNAGKGYNINIPLPPGSGDAAYAQVIERIFIPALQSYQPQLIIVASGLDAGCYDPLGRMALTPDGFEFMAKKIREAAEELCEGRIVMCQEGGYDLASTPYMGLGIIEGLSGLKSPQQNPFQIFGSTLGYTSEVLPHQESVIAAAEKLVRHLN